VSILDVSCNQKESFHEGALMAKRDQERKFEVDLVSKASQNPRQAFALIEVQIQIFLVIDKSVDGTQSPAGTRGERIYAFAQVGSASVT
jgi:hypothetical protein